MSHTEYQLIDSEGRDATPAYDLEHAKSMLEYLNDGTMPFPYRLQTREVSDWTDA